MNHPAKTARAGRKKKKYCPMEYHRKKQQKKLTDYPVTLEFIHVKSTDAFRRGFDVPKYLFFSGILLREGYAVTLYEARLTVSKYLTICKEGHKPFKVRFSDHKPLCSRELAGDCDFFVGHTNLTITTTAMAINAVRKHFAEAA